MSVFGEKLHQARWNKSSYSTNSIGCVEVALTSSAAGVRDSKARNSGTLVFDAQHWKSFIASLKK